MPIDFYYTPGSAPCRSVLLAAKALDVNLNLKLVDLSKGEHLKPEFVKLNPQHTVPTLDDNGFVVTESRATLCYLAEQYGKDDSLYPKDPKKRAVVNQRLYFDMGTLYQRFGEVYYPIAFQGKPYDAEKGKLIDVALEFLDGFLSKTSWVAGDNMTIADFAVISSISTMECVGVEVAKYENINKWYQKAKKTMKCYDDTNGAGTQKFKEMYEFLTKKK